MSASAQIDEIADSIYRIHVAIPPGVLPGGFSFNQYLIVDDEPLLFHTGSRGLFPLVKDAIARVLPLERLRFVGFSHWEQDECGALNQFLAIAPRAVPVCSAINAMINSDGMDRPPRVLKDGEKLPLGRKRVRWIDTPHLPHGWESGLLLEETGATLFCGDLLTQPGTGDAPVVESDILEPSEAMRRGGMDYYSNRPHASEQLGKLATTNPKLLACMHGSAFRGDGGAMLRALAKSLSDRGKA